MTPMQLERKKPTSGTPSGGVLDLLSPTTAARSRRRVAFTKLPSPEGDGSPPSGRESGAEPDASDLEDITLEVAPRTPARPSFEEARTPRGPRERILDRFYLFDAGDRETVRLLMRGMPLPVTYGFPGTDGTLASNLREFVYTFHPFVSIFKVHPLCPFSAKERLVVFFCSVAFNFLWTAFTEYHRNTLTAFFVGAPRQARGLGFYCVKHVATILYAVLIRQIVICPCLYNPLLAAACENDAPVGPARGVGSPHLPVDSRVDDAKVWRRAARLKRWKLRGDRGILVLLFVHVTMMTLAIMIFTDLIVGPAYMDAGDDNYMPRQSVAKLIVVSEVINFWFWFLKFAPLFAILYPIHRAQWFQGGTLCDYLLCRKSTCTYTREFAYKDPDYPRCVRPETRRVPASGLFELRHFARSGSLSTIKRADQRDTMLSIRANVTPTPLRTAHTNFYTARSERTRGERTALGRADASPRRLGSVRKLNLSGSFDSEAPLTPDEEVKEDPSDGVPLGTQLTPHGRLELQHNADSYV